MTTLLSPAEYSLWELAWKWLLTNPLRDHAGDQPWTVFTMEHLAEEGAHVVLKH